MVVSENNLNIKYPSYNIETLSCDQDLKTEILISLGNVAEKNSLQR